MPLQESLGGEAKNGVLTGGGASAAARGPTWRRHRWGAEGVVREELAGGAELSTGSAGWEINWRRLPPARTLWRKTMVGEPRCPVSLADAAGRLLVQEGRGDEAPL
jgi:hypothetical protein